MTNKNYKGNKDNTEKNSGEAPSDGLENIVRKLSAIPREQWTRNYTPPKFSHDPQYRFSGNYPKESGHSTIYSTEYRSAAITLSCKQKYDEDTGYWDRHSMSIKDVTKNIKLKYGYGAESFSRGHDEEEIVKKLYRLVDNGWTDQEEDRIFEKHWKKMQRPERDRKQAEQRLKDLFLSE